jgi:hypothetical protein
MARSTRRFTSPDTPWQAVEQWATAESFKLRHSDDVRRVYRKGIGIGAAPIYLQVIYAAPWAHLQAWVGVNILVRPGALLISPGEMRLETGGFRLARSRRLARAPVNRLLAKLGQPPIE